MQPWRVACARAKWAKRPWLGALGLERRPPSACTHVCAGFRVRWLACPAAQSASQVTSPARCTKLRLVVGNALHATPPPRGWAPAPAGLPAQTASPCFCAGGVSQPATPPGPSLRRQIAARGSTKPGLPRTEPHLELSTFLLPHRAQTAKLRLRAHMACGPRRESSRHAGATCSREMCRTHETG